MNSTLGRESSNSDNEDESVSFYSTSTVDCDRAGSTPSTSSSTADNEDPAVKHDNRMVTFVRGVVVFVLLVACVMTSILSFRITRDGQLRTFKEAFDGVAVNLGHVLNDDMSQQMLQASNIAAAVKLKIEDKEISPHLLDFGEDAWQLITKAARFTGVHVMGWNPLLSTDQERAEFEEMAAESVALSDQVPDTVCYVCGSPAQTVSNPEHFVEVPGLGPKTCGDIERVALAGLVQKENCDAIALVLQWGCTCGEADGAQEAVGIAKATQVSTIDQETGELVPIQNGTAPYMPIWNIGGSTLRSLPTMMDLMSSSHTRQAIDRMMEMNVPMFTETIERRGLFYEKYTGLKNDLSTTLLFPVDFDGQIVGSVSFELLWKNMITSRVPGLSEHVHIVAENTLGQNFTFGVNPETQKLIFLGGGDLHEKAFDSVVFSSTYDEFSRATNVMAVGEVQLDKALRCEYRFHVFATRDFQDIYLNKDPSVFAAIAASIFAFTSLVFILYDYLVRRVQRKVVDSAKHTTEIVSSLFPKSVRDRLLQQAADQGKSNAAKNSDAPMRISKMRMQSFLTGGSDDNASSTFNTDPIADLFASATVMFLDIASFTAWSSEREPSQVFVLLETIYQAFDAIAGRLKVFKVETIGDSYVAVCGLPTRREGHAPVMAKFAQRCLAAMKTVTKDLEVRLGPSTGDLKARVGLHSGPVTAGVMRGEKARFQLFGDTVNTAARLESSGKPSCIHVSQASVDLLEKAGKGHWVVKRDTLISMKGKGDMQTYFMKDEVENTASSHSKSSSPLVCPCSSATSGCRLVEFNTEILFDFLKRIVVHGRKRGQSKLVSSRDSFEDGNLVIDELTQTLCLPAVAKNTTGSTDKVKISPNVKLQLHEFVKRIAACYRDVPFHNFEHCSHVLMSTSKLMKRIVNPDDIDYKQTDDLVAVAIHKTTYGISSDPILQFASLFAALIHDVDHTGLTNVELIEEKDPLAEQYRNQSVAEQHSVDLAWKILMEPAFGELRKCIFRSDEDLVHFRQLVVNAVMATDIADKQLKQARETRWAETFSANPIQEEPESQHDRDRKATIVFDYIIQASDVCHTMQHWHTYQKFNKRLFEERYVAWLNGSLKKEPSLGWYGGEIWFFDNYIIPMANKLDKCGVFGVSYQEYLTYAKENRVEWERKGHEIVKEMKAHCDRKYASLGNIDEDEDDSTIVEV